MPDEDSKYYKKLVCSMSDTFLRAAVLRAHARGRVQRARRERSVGPQVLADRHRSRRTLVAAGRGSRLSTIDRFASEVRSSLGATSADPRC